MDGVFMRKTVIISAVLILVVFVLGLANDLAGLEDGLVRLHVVGASDSEEDQAVKLLVKDAVAEHLQESLMGAQTREEALELLRQELPKVEEIANRVLSENGFSETVQVTLTEEEFPRRDYDTFSLPAGIYQSLRVRIGEAAGKNWWCVVFPSFCLGAASEDLRDTAAGAGFSEVLTDTISGEPEYELRFFLLDCLGQLQNFFHGS